MNQESAVQFPTVSRIHIALAVNNLERSVRFYQSLWGVSPSKLRPGYTRFEVNEPPVNVSLNQVTGTTGPNNSVAHFGIQVKSTKAVQQRGQQLAAAGWPTRTEENVSCCYAVQDKVWVADPDGNQWEIYVVLHDDSESRPAAEQACCPGVPAIMDAVEQGDLASAQQLFAKSGGKDTCSCLSDPTTRAEE